MPFTDDEILDMIRAPEDYFPQRARLWGHYFGIVEDNNDPFKLGRLRVRTPIHFDTENIPTASLPWAHYVSTSGGDNNIGFYSVPPVGSMMVVAFIDGDSSYPVCLGGSWARPSGVSETHVASINEEDPYSIAAVPSGHSWEHVQYNSFTTPSGLKFELDDNISFVEGLTSVVKGVNYRRIGLEIPGDVEIEYSSATGLFKLGSKIVGQRSGASGKIAADAASKLTVMQPSGRFRDGETVVDEEGAEATISSVTIKDGFFMRMVEDKTQVEKAINELEGFRGVFEIGTKDHRVMRFDDEEKTIRIETPESDDDTPGGHFFEINSKDDFLHLESEFGHRLLIQDQNKSIDLSTPGDDVNERGYRFTLDQAEKFAILKGDEHKYFFHLKEKGDGFVGMFSPYPLKKNAGIQILDFYSGGHKDVVHLFANDGQGFEKNGIFLDRGDGARPQAVYFHDTARNSPTNWIRLVTKAGGGAAVDGQVDIGQRDGSNSMKFDPQARKIDVTAGSGGLTLKTTNNVLVEGSGSPTSVKIKGPWVSNYFLHTHKLDSIATAQTWLLFDSLGLPVSGTAETMAPTTGK